jgi:hypothetical protein
MQAPPGSCDDADLPTHDEPTGAAQACISGGNDKIAPVPAMQVAIVNDDGPFPARRTWWLLPEGVA